MIAEFDVKVLPPTIVTARAPTLEGIAEAGPGRIIELLTLWRISNYRKATEGLGLPESLSDFVDNNFEMGVRQLSQVAPGGVHDALRLAGGTRGVQQNSGARRRRIRGCARVRPARRCRATTGRDRRSNRRRCRFAEPRAHAQPTADNPGQRVGGVGHPRRAACVSDMFVSGVT
jgi:hypothetical protein